MIHDSTHLSPPRPCDLMMALTLVVLNPFPLIEGTGLSLSKAVALMLNTGRQFDDVAGLKVAV